MIGNVFIVVDVFTGADDPYRHQRDSSQKEQDEHNRCADEEFLGD